MLLKNICTSATHMDIHCNAGVATTNQIGDLAGYGTVWYHPQGIANILSLACVKACGYHVTYNSKNGNAFHIHKPDGTVWVFQESDRGLYFMDTNANGTLLVNTVAENKSKYTNRDYSCAVLARQIQQIMGRPSTRSYRNIIDKNLLPNCPITRRNILAAEEIFGPDVGSLKGKTVRSSNTHINPHIIDITAEHYVLISKHHPCWRHHVCQSNPILHDHLPQHQIFYHRNVEEPTKHNY